MQTFVDLPNCTGANSRRTILSVKCSLRVFEEAKLKKRIFVWLNQPAQKNHSAQYLGHARLASRRSAPHCYQRASGLRVKNSDKSLDAIECG